LRHWLGFREDPLGFREARQALKDGKHGYRRLKGVQSHGLGHKGARAQPPQRMIDEKGVEAYIAELPDVADAVEYISVPQPALGGGNG